MALSRLRPGVVSARERLVAQRRKIAERHRAGGPGIQISRSLCDLLDETVLDLFEAILLDLHETEPGGLREEVALVAHGGYGRRDVAPYSDVDLMILHAPSAARRVAPLAERLLQDVFDVGLVLGQSVRTTAQACQLAREDATIWSALVESRLLAGSQALFDQFFAALQKTTRRGRFRLLQAVTNARDEERRQYGDTIFLLEPNVKRSHGALRDLQLLRWTGFARYDAAAAGDLQLRGRLTGDEVERLSQAYEFLLRVRNELHFHAGKSCDLLDRAEQVRAAAAFGYRGGAELLPVEAFMSEYFRRTTDVSRILTRFLDNAQPRARWREMLVPLVAHRVEGDFFASHRAIHASRRGAIKLRGNLLEILRLADLANQYDARIAHRTRELVRSTAGEISPDLAPEAAARFVSLLGKPARLGELLRFLHDCEVLEKIIPAFRHARALLQFNEYHKFTVDEHCLRAVECGAELARDEGLVGEVYRSIQDKAPLHLALLIHDLGKGLPGDHSDVGLEIAAETAARLRLSEADAETVKFLVHKHLNMAHLAFRRDTSDPQLVVKFAAEVGTAEKLRMLLALTAADYAAVGPGVWNNWKATVLADLYRRTLWHLAGETGGAAHDRVAKRRGELQSLLEVAPDAAWHRRQIESLPSGYLLVTPPDRVVADLTLLHELPTDRANASGRFLVESDAMEYTVAAREDLTPGPFHKLTGALTSQRLAILSADINTLADGLILDRFVVADPDYMGEPPPLRIDEVCRSLTAALAAPQDGPPRFPKIWKLGADRRAAALPPPPTRVHIDNATSERYTVIDVFAADKVGLLYTISRALFELGLSVWVAKIGTHLDQVVDVFYVTDTAGAKLELPQRLAEIRQQLTDRIEAFLHADDAQPDAPLASQA